MCRNRWPSMPRGGSDRREPIECRQQPRVALVQHVGARGPLGGAVDELAEQRPQNSQEGSCIHRKADKPVDVYDKPAISTSALQPRRLMTTTAGVGCTRWFGGHYVDDGWTPQPVELPTLACARGHQRGTAKQ